MEEKKFCKFCGEKISKDDIVCPKCGRQLKLVDNIIEKREEKGNIITDNKFYTKDWFMWLMLIFFAPVGIFIMWKFHDNIKQKTKIILTIVFGLIFLLALFSNSDEENESSLNNNSNDIIHEKSSKKIEVIDFSSMTESEILIWCKNNYLNCNFKREYSDTIEKDKYIKQSINATEKVNENSKITIFFSLGKEPSIEYKNALKKAESYSKLMHMSKKKIYDQLTSEYGENFPSDAAQYAIDNINADWYKNALEKAKSYQNTMHMSKQKIYDQLISEYGEAFTTDEAQYAIDHLDD